MKGKLYLVVAVESNCKDHVNVCNNWHTYFRCIQNVKVIILDQTAKKCATVLAEAATEEQEHVTLGVNRDGKDSFVTNVGSLKCVF